VRQVGQLPRIITKKKEYDRYMPCFLRTGVTASSTKIWVRILLRLCTTANMYGSKRC